MRSVLLFFLSFSFLLLTLEAPRVRLCYCVRSARFDPGSETIAGLFSVSNRHSVDGGGGGGGAVEAAAGRSRARSPPGVARPFSPSPRSDRFSSLLL